MMASVFLTAFVGINSLFQVTLSVVPSQIPKTVMQFSISDGNQLQHIEVHRDTGDVYVGAHNMIYKLDEDLNMQSQQNWLTAGLETTQCPPGNANCNSETNDNKVLTIDYENNFLLSCGSSHYGTCVLHGLDTVSNVEGRIMSNLANDSIAVGESVVAFFGQFRQSTVLYVASTYENNPPSTSIIQHAVASKRLGQSENGQWHLKLAHQDPVLGRFTYIDLRNDDVKRNFKIKYVYGFSVPGDPGFSYFLTVQRDGVDQQNYKTKIVRLCQEDKGFISYTEMTLRCRSYDTGENLRLLQAAYLGKAGYHLASSLSGVASDDFILYTVFSKSVSSSSREPVSGSALCVYPIPTIDRAIISGVQKCFNGVASRGLEHMERSESTLDCGDLQYEVLNSKFCGTSQLHPIDTDKTMTATDSLRGGGNDDIFTSVIVKAMGEDTIAVIGTKSGHLLKFLVQAEEEETAYAAIPYKNLLLDGPVLQDMAFDRSEEHLYAMTPETIYKFSLSTCDHYHDCSACILTHDPNQCGWCGTGCAMREDCEEEGGNWVMDFCPPVIYEVIPLSAPLNSSVEVTLIGDNLGTSLGHGIHEFTVAGRPCAIQMEKSDSKRIVCTVEPVPYQLFGPVVAHVEASSIDPVYRVNGTHSDFLFSFSDLIIEGIRPMFGQVAGGTNLTIYGTGLNSGNSRTVIVADLPCLVISTSFEVLVCTTTGSMDITNGIVVLSVDDRSFASTQEFTYMLPPIVKSYSPTGSYLSGGRLLVVNGANLHVVEEPKIVVTIEKNQQSQTIEQKCDRAEPPGSVMVCPSPNLAQQGLAPSTGGPITGSVSFIFEAWYDMAVEIGQEMLYYADPVFNRLPSDVQVSKGSKLIIEGTNLDVASNASEIDVVVRDKACTVTDLTQKRLVCKVPALDYTTEENDAGHLVTVTIGNSVFEIGRVQYVISSTTLNVTAIVLVIVFLIVTVIILVLLFLYVRNRRKGDTISVNGIPLTPERVAYARSISLTGSQHSGSQFSGEARVVPPMSPLRNNTYLRNPSSESRVEEARPLLQQIGNELAAQVGEVLINESNLKLGDTIGQGHFGCVYEGMFLQDGEGLHVAVKSLLHGATSDISNFLREGIMMKDFKHENVLRLIGVCIKDDRIPLVVLPFMKHGDLLTYIRNPQNELTARQLLEFCRGIADGMAYLASLKFVHRDLAARNCMLDEVFCVKVADFGLSRDIYERDYYSAKDKTAKLPVRWMALECLERNIYNTKTDVWSYGIVMWELMTRGVTPYPSVDNCDLSTFLQRGRRLPQPPHCPDNVYDVMNSCWLVSPVDRPTFSQLVTQLDEILTSEEEAAAFDQHQIYINV